MAVQTISYIKGRFVTGAIPTQQDFADLVDTLLALAQCKVLCFIIKSDPSGPGQKPPGLTLQDDRLIGRSLLDVQMINGISTSPSIAGISFDNVPAVITYPNALAQDDIVIVFYI